MRVFLDACVLYPPLVRSLILSLADAGEFVPFWSPRVLEEWRRAILKAGFDGEEIEAAQQRMAARFPEASVIPDAGVEAATQLPDPADAHVLAGALAARADLILTFNLRDFPARTLAGQGLVARHPDSFLWELFSDSPQASGPVILAVLEAADIAPDRHRAVLKRARLSRFGKAFEAWVAKYNHK